MKKLEDYKTKYFVTLLDALRDPCEETKDKINLLRRDLLKKYPDCESILETWKNEAVDYYFEED